MSWDTGLETSVFSPPLPSASSIAAEYAVINHPGFGDFIDIGDLRGESARAQEVNNDSTSVEGHIRGCMTQGKLDHSMPIDYRL